MVSLLISMNTLFVVSGFRKVECFIVNFAPKSVNRGAVPALPERTEGSLSFPTESNE
jgi:hypothetical protein